MALDLWGGAIFSIPLCDDVIFPKLWCAPLKWRSTHGLLFIWFRVVMIMVFRQWIHVLIGLIWFIFPSFTCNSRTTLFTCRKYWNMSSSNYKYQCHNLRIQNFISDCTKCNCCSVSCTIACLRFMKSLFQMKSNNIWAQNYSNGTFWMDAMYGMAWLILMVMQW